MIDRDLSKDLRLPPLRRMQGVALSLLLAALVGLLLSSCMDSSGVWPWLRSFCEAAAVGAIADWFAVVALFRHPMRLPLPHTAIVAKSKDRVAEGLAHFVQDHVLDAASLRERWVSLDPAAQLGGWLSRPEQVRRVGGTARVLAVESLGLLDDRTVRRVIKDFVVLCLRRWDAAGTAADVLGLLTRDGRHHELLDAALVRLAGYLEQPNTQQKVSALMLRHARREWPTMVTLVDAVKSVDGLADSLSQKLAAAMLDEFREILSRPEHPVRLGYEAWLANLVTRLQHDEALVAHVDHLKSGLIEHPGAQDHVDALWNDIFLALQRDLASPDSAVVRHLEAGLLRCGQTIAGDPELRRVINAHFISVCDQMAEGLRTTVTTHIAQTIRSWDDHQLARELELSVGRDLQFIRINGTLVGGVVGLSIHAVAESVGHFLL